MFIDETTIIVQGGNGGNGCFSHDRQRGKPSGKPSGGDGGDGGSIFLVASGQLHTLQDVSYHRTYTADRGDHGKGSTKTGRCAEDIHIGVPLGTIVQDAETKQIIVDCLSEGKKFLIARGGRGGKGNAALHSHRNLHPDRALPGQKGEVRRLLLTLKVLADVGLVGRPNAGKSTFLSTVSHARPKIADYPFTTTEPHLGIVRFGDSGGSFVMADIPGLIENSHTGKGLGIRFLRHIERTRILAIMVEALSENPKKDADMLIKELRAYSPSLAAKPRCFILTKADVSEVKPPKVPRGWLWMSAVTGENVDKVLKKLHQLFLDEKNKAQ